MLQKIIEEIIQPLFTGEATWVEKYGGLVQTLEVKTTIDPEKGTQKVEKWPISCEVNQTECNEPSDTYRDLIPDDSKASILYFEEVQPMSFQGFVSAGGSVVRNWQRYSGRVRLVVWLNAARLGIGSQNGNYVCDWSYPFQDQMLKLINTKGKATSGSFDGGVYDIRPSGLVRKDLGIFSKYTYNQYKNYYRYPFDYFAIDFDIDIQFCAGKNTTIPTGAVINCPFAQGDLALLNQYSLLYDGIDEYIQAPDNDTLSFGNGATDTGVSVSFWMRPISTGSTQWVMAKRGALEFPNQDEYQITLDSSGFLRFAVYSQLQMNNRVLGTTDDAIMYNQWVHIAFTWDGSVMRYYKDGILSGLTVSTTGTYIAMDNGNRPLNIGTSWRNDNYFQGYMDEISLFKTALDSTGVDSLRLDSKPANLAIHPNYTDMVLWYRMGDDDTWTGTNWDITDNSQNTNNATSFNMEEADRTTETP